MDVWMDCVRITVNCEVIVLVLKQIHVLWGRRLVEDKDNCCD